MLDLLPASGARLSLHLIAREGGLTVHVAESTADEAAAAEIALPPVEDVLGRLAQPTFHEEVGRGLFRALLPGELGDRVRAACANAAAVGETLTLDLLAEGDLAVVTRYPWELLHDGTRFLLQSGAVNLVRSLDAPALVRPVAPRSPLEVLFVAARPGLRPALAPEFDALQAAFETSIRADQLDLAYLLPPTWDALMDWLLAGGPGVLHFAGRGDPRQPGALVFEDEGGQPDPVDAVTLASALNSTDLRLVVLSESASLPAAGESPLGTAAPALIQAGIPAVVTLPQSLPESAAIRFMQGLYGALIAGQDMASAVAAGRAALRRTMYWHIPTLYVQVARVSPEMPAH
jgi:hypothetical protein